MLELKNLSFQVETENGKKDILKNINLTLNDNELVVITGPNGSGKSTLAKIIMGIERQTSGQMTSPTTPSPNVLVSVSASLCNSLFASKASRSKTSSCLQARTKN